jgi:non-ribosomal peptide synthetase component F
VGDPLLRSHLAAEPRTLVVVLRATVRAHPDARAIDNGREVLTYEEALEAADAVARALREQGIGRGDTVGIRIPSGTTDLYVAVLGVLCAGAAYVPVDHDDPEERARVVFREAGVAAVLTADLIIRAAAADVDPAPVEDPGQLPSRARPPTSAPPAPRRAGRATRPAAPRRADHTSRHDAVPTSLSRAGVNPASHSWRCRRARSAG